MTDFGLSLEQVNTQQYKDLEDSILEELSERILERIKEDTDSEEEHEIVFPLPEEQQEIAREEFIKIVNKQSKNTMTTTISGFIDRVRDLSLKPFSSDQNSLKRKAPNPDAKTKTSKQNGKKSRF